MTKDKITILGLVGFALGIIALAAIAEDISNRTIRYRVGSVLTFDGTVTLNDEDGAWTMQSGRLSLLANFTNSVRQVSPTVKAAFSTNYTSTGTDGILFCNGTNQLITLQNAAAVAAGKMLTIVAATNNGSVTVTNYNGSQTILGGLSVPITSTNRLTVISDGSNWW